MSTHHGHHRSNHSRSRAHHSSSSSSHYQSNHNRSRLSSINQSNNSIPSGSSRLTTQPSITTNEISDWSEHRSSSGKVYYYNNKTGISQWEIPSELRQHRPASPESEISESSSIRQQQDKSSSPSASTNSSARSESASEDKPLLTPGLKIYFKPELISNFTSSRIDELERQAKQYAKEAHDLSERILTESVDLKIAKSVVHYVEISLEAQEKKYSILKNTIDNFGFA